MRGLPRLTAWFVAVAIAATAFPSSGRAAKDLWLASLEEGKRFARERRKEVLVYFHAPRSRLSQEVNSKVLTEARLRRLYQAFELVQLDVTKHEALATELAPEAFRAPIVVVLRPTGERRALLDNISSPEEWRKRLDEATRRAGGSFKTLEDLYDKAEEHVRAGRLDDAETLYRRALEFAPDKSRVYNGLGVVAARREDYDKAVEYLRKAVDLSPDYAVAKANLENAEKMKRRKDRERKGIVLTPPPANHPILDPPYKKLTGEQIDSLLSEGRAAVKREDYDEARALFQRILIEDGKHIPALNYLGAVEEKAGYYDRAIYYWQRTLKVDPQNGPALKGIETAREKQDR